MFNDATGMFLLLVSFGLTFVVARTLGKRLRSKREAERAKQAERDLSNQSRQVRRAAERKKKG